MLGAALPFTWANAQSVAPIRDELTRNPRGRHRIPVSTWSAMSSVALPAGRSAICRIGIKIAESQFNNLKGATVDELVRVGNIRRDPSAGRGDLRNPRCGSDDPPQQGLSGRRSGADPADRERNGPVRGALCPRSPRYAHAARRRAEEKLAGYLSELTEDEIFNRNKRRTLSSAGAGPARLQCPVDPEARRKHARRTGRRSHRAAPALLHRRMVQNIGLQRHRALGRAVRASSSGCHGPWRLDHAAFYSTLDFKDSKSLQLGARIPPGNEGLRQSRSFTYAWTEPEIEAANVDTTRT